MTYAFFEYDSDCNAKNRMEAVSLSMLIPESKLECFDVSSTQFNRDRISTNSIQNLIGFFVCKITGASSVAVVMFQKELKSDKSLLAFIGSNYV